MIKLSENNEKYDLLKQIEILKKENEKLKKRKKYGIVWEEHPEELNINTFPMLAEVKTKNINADKKKGINLLIEGDNYHSLRSILYTHKGEVDAIYIDPPYNTGNEFIYNDKKVDIEDSYRHSKWLSFMSKRLEIAKELLTEQGLIFISIDDNEMAQLKLLCDDIFDEKNVEMMIWHKVGDDSGRLKITKRFRREHEYIIVCYKNKDKVFFKKYETERDYKNTYNNPDSDPRGPYKQGIISHTEEKSRENGKNFYSVVTPSGRVVSRQWRVTEEEFQNLREDDRIYFGKNGDSIPSLKVFINEKKMATPVSILTELGTAKSAGNNLKDIFGERVFSYPKPVELIKHLLKISTKENATILDFFAGSGTTGHAVLELNMEDGGNRKFILCTNNENRICENVTYQRLEKVINGYENSKSQIVNGLGGNLKYYQTIEIGNIKKQTDEDLEEIVDNSIELLKIKHESFEDIFENSNFIITKNNTNYLAILKNQEAVEDFIKKIKTIKEKVVIYLFSWSEESFNFLTEEIRKFVNEPIFKHLPEDITRFYRNQKNGGIRNE